MANTSRTVSDVLTLMRRILSRRNENDPDSTEEMFLSYLNDFVSQTMSNDVRLFEQFGTLSFTIDDSNTSGVYTFNDVGASSDFVTVSNECFISILDPVDNSVSWNQLLVFQDPGEFFTIWGINNDEILIPGFPTNVLIYGNEFTFRTIPNTEYLIKFYGYKKNPDYENSDENIQFDYWLRYLAYGASLNYALDFRYDDATIARIKLGYSRERKLMLAHTHNQIKNNRAMPRF